ncbi:MAG: hypothetical protein PHD58_03175 [Anaerolineales bacterium]|nr:hypothetical protein [Anaerolineales bacterium]
MEEQCYAKTGHWVAGEFRKIFLSVPDPELIYGCPISRPFLRQNSGRVFQYFLNSRFEFIPTNSAGQRVLITPIGHYLYQPGDLVPIPDGFPPCRTFPQTGFEVCYDFLDYYLQHGGEPVFGYPISNMESYQGRFVQWFQYARLEWHPEFSTGPKITLTDLGLRYFNFLDEDHSHLLPETGNNRPQTILWLEVDVFTAQAVMHKQGTQELDVIVRDQNNIPVTNAAAVLIVRLPSGQVEEIKSTTLSNHLGVIHFTFPVASDQTGQAVIDVLVAHFTGLEAHAQTSFRIWY